MINDFLVPKLKAPIHVFQQDGLFFVGFCEIALLYRYARDD